MSEDRRCSISNQIEGDKNLESVLDQGKNFGISRLIRAFLGGIAATNSNFALISNNRSSRDYLVANEFIFWFDG